MSKKVLCVAEKNSIAKAVANHLAGRPLQARDIAGTRFIKNYEFDYTFPSWGPCKVVMTSVAGHLMSQDFATQFKSWSSCDPAQLFEAQIDTYVSDDNKPIAKNIETQARNSNILYIWTDCDREGEHIGSEIRDLAFKSNHRLKEPGNTMRARFSNIERAHVINAARNPVPLDQAQADAVASRMEIDLRIGASFTRNLSLTLQPLFPIEERKNVISYGSCQFPTLGFVVERYLRVRNFVPESFWNIKIMHQKDGVSVNFHWSRGNLFDRAAVVILFERCLLARTARATKVQTKPTSKWKPLPLTTVELQKCGSRFLHMDSQRVMKVAEELYQKGWISYPRTETDQFDGGMDLRSLVQKQTQSNRWGTFAQGLVDGAYGSPRNGRNNDKAHPPIHPVNFVEQSALDQDHQRVYEFVVRRFLACCSQDARGMKTDIAILYGNETFNASGLTVTERNYLDVYPYDKWTSSQELPRFEVGETFEPTEAKIHEGQTTAPGYLTEPELIALMDANGIGTDATMAEHIAKIKDRKYVQTRSRARRAGQADDDDDGIPEAEAQASARGRGRGRARGRGGRSAAASSRGATTGVQEFIPTTLGIALIEGYENMGFEVSLAKPFLRKEMELKMKAICEGRLSRRDMIAQTLDQYRNVYGRTQQRLDVLKAAVRKYVFNQPG